MAGCSPITADRHAGFCPERQEYTPYSKQVHRHMEDIRILIADDEKEIRELLRKVLERERYRAETAADVNLYASLLTGIPLYGVAAAWLYSREYTEDTLKNLLTIPVSRTGLLLSKLALLFLWILTLAVTAWALTLTLGLLGGFGGLSASLLLASFKQFTGAAALLFALCTPVICIALAMRHLVPAMIFSIAVTMVTVMGSTSEYKGLIPWSAAFDLVNGTLLPVYPALYSYVSIAATSIAGLAAALIHFERTDIP